MHKFLSLVKASMTDGMRVFTFKARDGRSQKILPIILVGMMVLSLFGSARTLIQDLAATNEQFMVLVVFTLGTAVLTVTEGIYKADSLLFKCRDNDMLLSMPIKKSTIVFLRMFKFYIFEVIYNAIFMLPAIVAYMFDVEFSLPFILTAIAMLIFLPIIPVVISCAVGAVVSLISTYFKKSTIFQTLFSFLLLALMAWLMLFLFSSPDINGSQINQIGQTAINNYYPAAAVAKLATNFNISEFLLFIGIHLGIFVLTILMIGKIYFYVVTKISIVRQKEVKRTNGKIVQRSQIRAMVKKDLTKYFNTPVLVVNTAMGLVLFMIAIVAVCFKFEDIANSIAQSDFPLSMDLIQSYLPSVVFVLIAFTGLLTFITSTSFSLEGRAFNILKTLPIDGRKVMFAKILTSLLLTVPIMILGVIIAFIRFRFGLVDLLLILCGTVIIPSVTETAGILIDLKYARFNADSDAEIVKQSPGVMISSFLGLGLTLVSI